MRIKEFMLVFMLLSFQFTGWGQVADYRRLPEVVQPVFKNDTFFIVKYGAVSDGFTLNTQSINKAITDCSAKGGGVVLVPPGIWLTGPLELKSNVNLHIQRSATLLFTADKDQYQLVAANWEGLEVVRNQSPISGTDLENIAITGKGIIDGNGDAWRAVKKAKVTDSQWKTLVASGGVVSEDGKQWFPSRQYMEGSMLGHPGTLSEGKTVKDYADYKDFFRPNLLVLTRCKKVLLDGPTFQNSAAWCLHPLMCENLTVRDLNVKNPWYAQNGDGIDVESCSNVLIENSIFDVGDDGICIKSGRDEEGRKRGMPTQNVIARNCVVYAAHGGFVIGSEMSGGVKNMFVENCTFIGTDIGLRFKTKRGRGGVVEKVYIRNIVMKDIVGEAILFDMYYMAKDPVPLAGEERAAPVVETFPVTESTPVFKDFHIENVVCNGAEKAIFVRGLPEMNISDLSFRNIQIVSDKGIEITEARNIQLVGVQVHLKETNPVVSIHNSGNILLDEIKYDKGAELLLKLSGAKSNEVKIRNTNISDAKTKVVFSESAKARSVKIK